MNPIFEESRITVLHHSNCFLPFWEQLIGLILLISLLFLLLLALTRASLEFACADPKLQTPLLAPTRAKLECTQAEHGLAGCRNSKLYTPFVGNRNSLLSEGEHSLLLALPRLFTRLWRVRGRSRAGKSAPFLLQLERSSSVRRLSTALPVTSRREVTRTSGVRHFCLLYLAFGEVEAEQGVESGARVCELELEPVAGATCSVKLANRNHLLSASATSSARFKRKKLTKGSKYSNRAGFQTFLGNTGVKWDAGCSASLSKELRLPTKGVKSCRNGTGPAADLRVATRTELLQKFSGPFTVLGVGLGTNSCRTKLFGCKKSPFSAFFGQSKVCFGVSSPTLCNNVINRKYKIIRPLLSFSRNNLTIICKDLLLPVYPDKSNKVVQYSRNRLREQILPAIKLFFNPKIDDALFKLAELLTQDFSLLSVLVNNRRRSSSVLVRAHPSAD